MFVKILPYLYVCIWEHFLVRNQKVRASVTDTQGQVYVILLVRYTIGAGAGGTSGAQPKVPLHQGRHQVIKHQLSVIQCLFFRDISCEPRCQYCSQCKGGQLISGGIWCKWASGQSISGAAYGDYKASTKKTIWKKKRCCTKGSWTCNKHCLARL